MQEFVELVSTAEPVLTPSNGEMVSVPRAALEWLANGETGSSSVAMCLFFMGVPSTDKSAHPFDGGDFMRCLKLLDVVPEWRPRILELAALNAGWAALVPLWDELERGVRNGDKATSHRIWDLACKAHNAKVISSVKGVEIP